MQTHPDERVRDGAAGELPGVERHQHGVGTGELRHVNGAGTEQHQRHGGLRMRVR